MLKLTKIITTCLATASIVSALLPKPSVAYQIFTNRDVWKAALGDASIITEEFNSTSNSSVSQGTTFASGIEYVDSGFLGGAAVSGNSLELGLAFPGSVDELAFPTPVRGFGFDFNNVGIEDFSKRFSVRGNFANSVALPNNGFFGVLASSNDELIKNFQIVSTGEIGSIKVDNISFASISQARIPEPSSILGFGILGFGWFLLIIVGAGSTRNTNKTDPQQKPAQPPPINAGTS